MIELSAVSKRYGHRGPPALRDVTLSVPVGGVWAVVGPNGAGKSTLLALMLGFIRPTRGTIRLNGERPRDFLRIEGAAYLPERFQLPAAWRTGESLRMLAALDRVAASRVADVIAMLDLGAHLGKRVDQLSRGLLQRLGLAQALLAPRALVVLDEPTEGLDPVWRIRLRDIVSTLSAEGATLIIASHDLGEIERIADRAVLLDAGAVREIIDVRSTEPSAHYRIRLAAPSAAVHDAFPEAVQADAVEFAVRVNDATELSQRLSALLALGAIVLSVTPVRQPLEDRVRDALAPSEDAAASDGDT